MGREKRGVKAVEKAEAPPHKRPRLSSGYLRYVPGRVSRLSSGYLRYLVGCGAIG